MRIASWNVNSLNVRLPHLEQWLQAFAPDVVGLQETKLEDHRFPDAVLAGLGYRSVFAGQKTYNGVAILAKQAPADVQVGIPGFDDEQKRAIAATVGDVRIVNLYVVNGQDIGTDKYAYKLRWLEAVRGWLAEELARHPKLVVLGDFNIAPDARDVHDPAVWNESHILTSRAEVARKDDDHVAEVDRSAGSVRQAAVVEHLKENVQDIRVRLLDLIKENDVVRPAADRLRQLAGRVVSDVAGRRADQPADAVLLHILAAVNANNVALIVEQRMRERLRELRLAYTRGAKEKERPDRLVAGAKANARLHGHLRDAGRDRLAVKGRHQRIQRVARGAHTCRRRAPTAGPSAASVRIKVPGDILRAAWRPGSDSSLLASSSLRTSAIAASTSRICAVNAAAPCTPALASSRFDSPRSFCN